MNSIRNVDSIENGGNIKSKIYENSRNKKGKSYKSSRNIKSKTYENSGNIKSKSDESNGNIESRIYENTGNKKNKIYEKNKNTIKTRTNKILNKNSTNKKKENNIIGSQIQPRSNWKLNKDKSNIATTKQCTHNYKKSISIDNTPKQQNNTSTSKIKTLIFVVLIFIVCYFVLKTTLSTEIMKDLKFSELGGGSIYVFSLILTVLIEESSVLINNYLSNKENNNTNIFKVKDFLAISSKIANPKIENVTKEVFYINK